MKRRVFGREFKVEAVKLIRERGVSVAQAARDLDVHKNVPRKWVKEFAADPGQAFPGLGQMKREQLEIERLRREVIKLKAERDILKKPRPTSRRSRCEVRLRRDASRDLAGGMVVRGARCLAKRLPCLARPATQPAVPDGRDFGSAGAVELCRERSDLRRPAGLARPAGRRHGLRTAPGPTADAPASPAGAACRRIGANGRPTRRRICLIGSSRHRRRTRNGWQTSPTSGRLRVGSMSPSCSTCSLASSASTTRSADIPRWATSAPWSSKITCD